ncbi:GGDEF domain-containing protein, partial [Oceanospirillum sp. HFRX-1_2]
VMLFGIFQLSMLEFAFVGLFSLVCFGGVIASDFYLRPDEVNLQLSLMQWLILASAQTWIALFGSYVRRLSERLKKQRHVLQHSNHKMQRANEELEQAMEQLDEIAGTDELTGILNRRRFFEESRLRLENTEQYQASALCMIDLDHFKKVNDRYGHQAGDLVLERFCQLTRECLRGSDLFGRYGGEEFILLLPQTNQDSGVQIAERIRLAFEQYSFDSIEPGLKLSTSIGVTLHRCGETLEETLKRADKALYQAKSSGRSQTIYISGARNINRALTGRGKASRD